VKLIVHGMPIPQGSKTGFVIGGRAVLTDGKKGPALKEWRMETNAAPLSGPVAMRVTFYLPRPKSAPRKVLYPATRPDLDKLVRSVFDSLQGIIYSEDSRIVDIDARKRFAVDSAPRAEIEVASVQ
jgi:crossover junction endodeoxyribonuclease RusA